MKVGIIQLNSKLNAYQNLSTIEMLIIEGKQLGADVFFLPEYFLSMSDGIEPTPFLVSDGNEWYNLIRALSTKHQIYLIGGSATTKTTTNPGRLINRAYNFDTEGNDLGHYDKIHLFSCDLPNKKMSEETIYSEGKKTTIVSAKGRKIGLNICFDLRFSEMALEYRNHGVEILSYASAFTVPTGKAHWHTLLRARAIESQCFVIASAQWGYHNDKIQTFGHSIAVDPWGDIIADLEEGEKVKVVDLDFQRLIEVRQSIFMKREGKLPTNDK